MSPTHETAEQESQLLAALVEYQRTLSSYPDGRIDYRGSPTVPLLVGFVLAEGEVLLLRRSDDIGYYAGKWHGFTGTLDAPVPLRTKVEEELREELGLLPDEVQELRLGERFDEVDVRRWIIHPVLAVLHSKVPLALNWEHSEARWVKVDEVANYDTLPSGPLALQRALRGGGIS